MIGTNLEAKAEPISPEIIPELINAAPPCITLLLPSYRPGEPAKPAASVLKVDLQDARKKLSARKITEPLITELLEPLHQLSHEEESLAGSGLSRVLFRSPGTFRQFELPIAPTLVQPCVVGNGFWIRPIFSSLALPFKVYVLYVTKKSAELLVCGFTNVEPVELPRGTPKTLDEALGFDAPDHDLMNRSFAGPSTGAMHGVQFGTGSGRERQHTHLRDFYRAVDRGVNEVLHSSLAPLVLAGVDEDMAIYRSINTHSNLLDQGIHGSPGAAIGPTQILRHAHDIALFSFDRRVAFEMRMASERFTPARFSTDLDTILRAAVEGRVSDLYLDESTQRVGNFDAKIFGGHFNWHDEDLLNVAAIEVLLHAGAVYSLPTHEMPRGAVAAATLRF